MLGVGKEAAPAWFPRVRSTDYGSSAMFVWKCPSLCGDTLGCAGLWTGMDDSC